jgi:nucleotide-binding universal stress UspA family protein
MVGRIARGDRLGCRRRCTARRAIDRYPRSVVDRRVVIVVAAMDWVACGGFLLGSVSSVLVHHSHCRVAVIYGEDPVPNNADFYADVAWDGVTTQAEEELAQRLAGWSERYPDVVVRRVVGQDNPADRLLKESAAAQLLVVGSPERRQPI